MRVVRSIHKWVGLFIGIQILLWITGGVVMSVIPLEMVRGKHLVHEPLTEMSNLSQFSSNIDMAHWREAKWVQRLDNNVLKLTAQDGSTYWQDVFGNPILPLDEDVLKRHLTDVYQGTGAIEQLRLITTLPAEAKRLKPPVFKADFDDAISTTLYVHPMTGKVLSVRSDLWRLFDFFWMLHILDFEEREDFNNPLLISMAIIAWLFLTTGFVLLYLTLVKPKWAKFRYNLSKG